MEFPEMRRVTRYTAAIKASVLSKAFAPNPASVVDLAKEFNIPKGTVYTWVDNMRKSQGKAGSVRSNDKSAEAKLQAVIDTASMSEQERGAYCREHGIYTHHLGEWREQFLQGFGTRAVSRKEAKAERIAQNEYNKLKRELHKKDKALAEVSALLILKKKADLLWGVADEDV